MGGIYGILLHFLKIKPKQSLNGDLSDVYSDPVSISTVRTKIPMVVLSHMYVQSDPPLGMRHRHYGIYCMATFWHAHASSCSVLTEVLYHTQVVASLIGVRRQHAARSDGCGACNCDNIA